MNNAKSDNVLSFNEKFGSEQTGHEFLAFTLGEEEYGIGILKVQELRGYESVTRIANAADFVKGVVNLRGIIVPIVDMRIKLNLGTPTYNESTVVIVLNFGNRTVGMVVDSVSDVITLADNEIKAPPQFGGAFDTDYVIGLGTVNERMIILVDAGLLLADADAGLLQKAAA